LRPNILGENTIENLRSYAVPLGRLLLASLFIWAGYNKLFGFGPAGTAGYFANNGVPLPEVAVWIAIIVELVGGIMILIGLQARWVALALAIWFLVTGFGWHLPAGSKMHDMIKFYKNLSMAGGFLYVFAYGAGALSLDQAIGTDKET
jgi:putative oxidoreductase